MMLKRTLYTDRVNLKLETSALAKLQNTLQLILHVTE